MDATSIIGSIVLALIIVLAILGSLSRDSASDPRSDAAPLGSAAEDEIGRLEARLSRMALGDHSLIERLAESKQRRTPGASRKEILERVIDAWERDHNGWR
jgi:hypothetical protein